MLRNSRGPVLDRCRGRSLTVRSLTWHQHIPHPSANKLQPVVAAPAPLPARPLCLGRERYLAACRHHPWGDQIQHPTSAMLPAPARMCPWPLGLRQPHR